MSSASPRGAEQHGEPDELGVVAVEQRGDGGLPLEVAQTQPAGQGTWLRVRRRGGGRSTVVLRGGRRRALRQVPTSHSSGILPSRPVPVASRPRATDNRSRTGVTAVTTARLAVSATSPA
jgi:hypothetical protein